MDDLLPSYDSVIERDPWKHIARWLDSEDLCSAAAVCHQWHKTFAPHLWGNPASHFGVQNDTVYTALTRFKRALPYVRPAVRELTHTLQFPPAHAEIYGGPHAEWLRNCLEYLPRLQCLIVDGLPFFDHAALLNLRHASLRWQSMRANPFPVFSLRLLDAAGCPNATSTGLAEALPHFPDLVSLDLSRTPAAKDVDVLTTLGHLRNLRVLRLRGLGLKDHDFVILSRAIGTRVRSLDLSNNDLTDHSAQYLLDQCMKESVIRPHLSRGPLAPVDVGNDNKSVDCFESQDLVTHLRRTLTNGIVGSLAIEEAGDVGVTHLFLARNSITAKGISGLIRSGRLQVLDIGDLPLISVSPVEIAATSAPSNADTPGIARLTPILSDHAKKLKYLRVDYKILTEDVSKESLPILRAELNGDLGRHVPATAHELTVTERPTPELDYSTTAVFELPADSTYATELPANSTYRPSNEIAPGIPESDKSITSEIAERPPTIEVTSDSHDVDDRAASAPEPLIVNAQPTPTSPLLPSKRNDNSSTISESYTQQLGLSPTTPTMGTAPEVVPTTRVGTRSRHNSTYYTEDRRARLDLRHSQENRLHPGMIPQVHTLVLTDIPTYTSDAEVVRKIIQFISDAAEEALIARQRARHTYILPPGRSRATAEFEYTRSLFALKRIIFEMAPPKTAQKKISSSWRAYPTKSSTEDKDSEAFWEAAAHDFSFFDDEECGLPRVEPGQTLPLAAMSGLELAPIRPVPLLEAQPTLISAPLLDVVGEIGKFRKDRKAAYQNLLDMGEVDPEVEGWWPGDITVVRKPAVVDQGELDCYGNRYESGWYYR